jgi:putative acetyltransferase
MAIAIARARPDGDEAAQLIAELDEVLRGAYPAESHHGYPVDKLIREGVHFFVLRVDGVAAGCGGIQFYPGFGEIKRMYTRPAYARRGLGRAMLKHLEDHARAQACPVLRLETGILQKDAIRLYERGGYVPIPPFPPYKEDPWSVFYEKRLAYP